MAEFYTEAKSIDTTTFGPGPEVLVQSYKRDRKVSLHSSVPGFRVGFAQSEVADDSPTGGFPVPFNTSNVTPFEFVLPSGTELWLAESISGGPTTIWVMVTPY